MGLTGSSNRQPMGHDELDRIVRQHRLWLESDQVVLVLSKHSVRNHWVEWELVGASKLSRTRNTEVLCPVALDEAWKTCDCPGPILRQMKDHQVLNFSEWQDTSAFSRRRATLLDRRKPFVRPRIHHGLLQRRRVTLEDYPPVEIDNPRVRPHERLHPGIESDVDNLVSIHRNGRSPAPRRIDAVYGSVVENEISGLR